MRAQMLVQARTEGAVWGSCGGGGMHGCMARKRSVWGSVAGHVCAAAGLGATGEERRRTTQRELEEVAAGRCVTSGISTLP